MCNKRKAGFYPVFLKKNIGKKFNEKIMLGF